MELKPNEGKKLEIEVNGIRYERYPVKTHFVAVGESYIDLMEKYIKPVIEEDCFVTLSEKIVSLCQKRILPKNEMKVSGLAKFLSKFASTSSTGIGVNNVYKMQYAIDSTSPGRVLWASICSGVGKIFGKKGIFYDMVGDQVRCLDGFYPDTFPIYGEFGIMVPENSRGVCNEITEKTGIPAVVVDANDFTCDIFGKSDCIDISDEDICKILKDNPSGQCDECTPFVIVKKIK